MAKKMPKGLMNLKKAMEVVPNQPADKKKIPMKSKGKKKC